MKENRVVVACDGGLADDGFARFRRLRNMGECAAVTDLEQVGQLAVAPSRPEAYLDLAAVALQRGDMDAAERSLLEARRHWPRCAEAYAGLASVRQHRRDYAGAFELYMQCLEVDNDNPAALLGLFQTSCQMGTFQRLIGYLELYLRRHRDDAAVLFCLGSLYAREGRLEAALGAIRRALDIEPDKLEARDMLRQVERALARRGGSL